MAAHFNPYSICHLRILGMMSWVTHRGRSSAPQAAAAGKQRIKTMNIRGQCVILKGSCNTHEVTNTIRY